MRNCGTEYSVLEGIASRFSDQTIKWWRVPLKGHSKPSLRSMRMKSPRLHGVHRLTRRLLIEVDPLNDGQRVLQLKPQQNPVLERGPQLVLTLAECGSETDNSRAGWNTTCVASILELLERGLRECLGNIIA